MFSSASQSVGEDEIQSFLRDGIPKVEFKRVSCDSDGVLELKGIGGFFNPSPPLKSKFLKGMMREEEFSSYIDAINLAAGSALIGLKKITIRNNVDHVGDYYQTFDAESIKGALKEVQKLNEQLLSRGIKFVLDEGPVYPTSSCSKSIFRLQTKAFDAFDVHRKRTYLYIILED